MPRLNVQDIKLRSKAVPKWSKRGQTISRTFKFEGFLDSISFVRRVAAKAEKANHHPDINIRWNKVTLSFTTHDEDGLTEKDFSMARQCDAAFAHRFGAGNRDTPTLIKFSRSTKPPFRRH